jgi:hypothetical protein
MLFRDSYHGVPDFWRLDSLEVYEISVCPHGIHFVFEVEEQENRHVAALTFPNPSPGLVEQRLGLDPTRGRGQERYALYQTRYAALHADLERVLDVDVGDGKQFDFGKLYPESRPIVVHSDRTLKLKWKGRSAELRGYLDVYFVLPA